MRWHGGREEGLEERRKRKRHVCQRLLGTSLCAGHVYMCDKGKGYQEPSALSDPEEKATRKTAGANKHLKKHMKKTKTGISILYASGDSVGSSSPSGHSNELISLSGSHLKKAGVLWEEKEKKKTPMWMDDLEEGVKEKEKGEKWKSRQEKEKKKDMYAWIWKTFRQWQKIHVKKKGEKQEKKASLTGKRLSPSAQSLWRQARQGLRQQCLSL